MNDSTLKAAARLITITIVTTGVILTTLRSIKIDVKPNTLISYETFSDVKLTVNGSASGDINLTAAQMSLLHYNTEDKKFYISSTANMENLTEVQSTSDYISTTASVCLNKKVNNGYLYINSFTADGEDALNASIRCLIKNQYNGVVVCGPFKLTNEGFNTGLKLGTTQTNLIIYFWYELDDEATTYENINAAEGAALQLDLALYVEETQQ